MPLMEYIFMELLYRRATIYQMGQFRKKEKIAVSHNPCVALMGFITKTQTPH